MTDTITSTGTWTCPTGVTSVDVECWGGGGGGFSLSGSSSARRTGGGGGAYSKKTGIAVSAGNNYTVTVGTGGSPSTSAPGAGNDSWFLDATTVLAKGGQAGHTGTSAVTTSSGGQAADGIGDTKFSGGDSVGHSSAFAARGGGAGAGTGADGGDATDTTSPYTGGTGGLDDGGDGGQGTNGGNATSGSVRGGGGGSVSGSSGTGGTGARGEVRITYTVAAGGRTNIVQARIASSSRTLASTRTTATSRTTI